MPTRNASPRSLTGASLADILFRSAALEVRRIADRDGRIAVVTFDSHHDEPGFARPGFGEDYFERENVGAIHVMCHGNDWFQHAEMPDALRAVLAAASSERRLLAYGSSMGGYAAIRFADAVGASAVLALSPQYSVDPRKMRFERRWLEDQRRIRFHRALDGRIRTRAHIVIAYDPHLDADRRHVDRIARDVAVTRLSLPHAGHPVGTFLAETALLAPLVTQVRENLLDTVAIADTAHRRRGSSSSWLGELAARQPPWRARCAVALARRAVAITPDSPAAHHRLGLRLYGAGEFSAAVAAHREAIRLHPAFGYRWSLGKALAAAEGPAAALPVAQSLQAAAPHLAGYHRWAADLRLALGDETGALADLRAATIAAPYHRGYRWRARRLAWSLRLARWRERLIRR